MLKSEKTEQLASHGVQSGRGIPLGMSLAALGIVFGDLGTSPLYALQEAFHPVRGVAPTPDNVIGCLSLFIWSLFVMVSVKYVFILMRADNHGEGGILALLALLVGDLTRSTPEMVKVRPKTRSRLIWLTLALVGTAMLYGDGVITPAISVLSAVEGLSVATTSLDTYVVPLTVVILIALFAIQHKGTGKVGQAFGPILAIWFVVILLLGLVNLAETPLALRALNPMEGYRFFASNGFRGFEALGAVVLCLTGGEALYADMGHFGRRPIQLAWYGLALPALVINYFGQGALLLRDPQVADHPFYAMVPQWALYPMVALATLATIVASQALISAVFSLSNQAMQLGLSPRSLVVYTSASTRGQIYMPTLNWLLMAATLAIVLGFKSSASLAAAFGLAVSTTMAITTILFAALARLRYGWGIGHVALVCGTLLFIDVAFVGANALKFSDGGCLPASLGCLVFLLMASWRFGRTQLAAARRGSGMGLATLIENLSTSPPHRVGGTAVFLTEQSHEAPSVLMHHLKHNQVLHERVIMLTLMTTDAPRVPDEERLHVESLGMGFVRLIVHLGFMESPDVPELLQLAVKQGLIDDVDLMQTSFYMGRETLALPRDWRVGRGLLLRIFNWLRKNELDATSHFNIPANRVLELGARLFIPAHRQK